MCVVYLGNRWNHLSLSRFSQSLIEQENLIFFLHFFFSFGTFWVEITSNPVAGFSSSFISPFFLARWGRAKNWPLRLDRRVSMDQGLTRNGIVIPNLAKKCWSGLEKSALQFFLTVRHPSLLRLHFPPHTLKSNRVTLQSIKKYLTKRRNSVLIMRDLCFELNAVLWLVDALMRENTNVK